MLKGYPKVYREQDERIRELERALVAKDAEMDQLREKSKQSAYECGRMDVNRGEWRKKAERLEIEIRRMDKAGLSINNQKHWLAMAKQDTTWQHERASVLLAQRNRLLDQYRFLKSIVAGSDIGIGYSIKCIEESAD